MLSAKRILKQWLDRFLIITKCQPTIKFYPRDISSGLGFVFVQDIHSIRRFKKNYAYPLNIYLNLLFSSNRIPVLGCNPNSPIKVYINLTTSLSMAIHPEACQVVSSLLSSKCDITMSCVLTVMKIVSIW